jgi:hypothetical protein
VTDVAMKTKWPTRPITIFTPSSADEDNTNAQNLTVKEIVARLPPEQFRVIMISEGRPDPRIATRGNTDLVRWTEHWNTVRLLRRCFFPRPDIYFFPRCGPLDRAFFESRKCLGKSTALVSYVVMMMNDLTDTGLIGRSIIEADRLCSNSKYVADRKLPAGRLCSFAWQVAAKPKHTVAPCPADTIAATSPFWGICRPGNWEKKCGERMFSCFQAF